MNVPANVSVNVPDPATFCPADRYRVVGWITKNWMFTPLLWSSSSLLLRFETGYPGETGNSKISVSVHHYVAFRACDRTFSATFKCSSIFTSVNTNFTHSVPRRASIVLPRYGVPSTLFLSPKVENQAGHDLLQLLNPIFLLILQLHQVPVHHWATSPCEYGWRSRSEHLTR